MYFYLSPAYILRTYIYIRDEERGDCSALPLCTLGARVKSHYADKLHSQELARLFLSRDELKLNCFARPFVPHIRIPVSQREVFKLSIASLFEHIISMNDCFSMSFTCFNQFLQTRENVIKPMCKFKKRTHHKSPRRSNCRSTRLERRVRSGSASERTRGREEEKNDRSRALIAGSAFVQHRNRYYSSEQPESDTRRE